MLICKLNFPDIFEGTFLTNKKNTPRIPAMTNIKSQRYRCANSVASCFVVFTTDRTTCELSGRLKKIIAHIEKGISKKMGNKSHAYKRK
jgi:hypothetical protein